MYMERPAIDPPATTVRDDVAVDLDAPLGLTDIGKDAVEDLNED